MEMFRKNLILDLMMEIQNNFAQDLNKVLFQLNHLNILVGCFGTDIRRIKQIGQQSLPIFNKIYSIS